MKYRNGKDIFPPELLTEIQKYITGELVYIPKPEHVKAGWGEINGARQDIQKRNKDIHSYYKLGKKIDDLAEMFHLSEDSIKKIVYIANS